MLAYGVKSTGNSFTTQLRRRKEEAGKEYLVHRDRCRGMVMKVGISTQHTAEIFPVIDEKIIAGTDKDGMPDRIYNSTDSKFDSLP